MLEKLNLKDEKNVLIQGPSFFHRKTDLPSFLTPKTYAIAQEQKIDFRISICHPSKPDVCDTE
jgi:hypothetical protein